METTDLTHHIQSIRLVDTHEHMRRENDWVENGPDILQDLFGNYVPADLNTAGAPPRGDEKSNGRIPKYQRPV